MSVAMEVAIYITIAFTTASSVLSIVALAVVSKFKDDIFSLESKLAETDGRIEGLAGKTIKGVDVGVE